MFIHRPQLAVQRYCINIAAFHTIKVTDYRTGIAFENIFANQPGHQRPQQPGDIDAGQAAEKGADGIEQRQVKGNEFAKYAFGDADGRIGGAKTQSQQERSVRRSAKQ